MLICLRDVDTADGLQRQVAGIGNYVRGVKKMSWKHNARCTIMDRVVNLRLWTYLQAAGWITTDSRMWTPEECVVRNHGWTEQARKTKSRTENCMLYYCIWW